MNAELIVLDNSVLSAFYAVDWLNAVGFYADEHQIATTERVWYDEFLPVHEISKKPDWLEVLPTYHHPKVRSGPIVLSVQDLSCIELGRFHGDAVIVGNDRRLLEVAGDEGLERMWGTKFARQLFRECGISTDSFDESAAAYTEDVFLPEEVAKEFLDTSKPNQD